MLFNILCGNSDDHARNHAAFWDGYAPALTPAYDFPTNGLPVEGRDGWYRLKQRVYLLQSLRFAKGRSDPVQAANLRVDS